MVPQVMNIAHKKKLFDSTGGRKIHHGAVPRLGGISFTPSIIFSVLLILSIFPDNTSVANFTLLENDFDGMFLLFCGMICLFVVGIADDLIEVRYRNKFIVQILVGILVVRAGMVVNNLYGFAGLHQLPEWIGWILTILLIVYIINSFNLIDGIDGLSGGLALLPMAFYGYVCYISGHFLYSMIAFAAAGSILPFLYYNIFGNVARKKKIFMGDTGSLTIGLVLGFLGIQVLNIKEYGEILSTANPVVLAVSPMVIPMFDQLRVFFHRIVRHRNPFLPDKSHIHHKLLYIGLSTHQALLAILGIAILFIVINMCLTEAGLNVTWIILLDLAIWTGGNMLLTSAIRRKERKEGVVLSK